MKSETFGGFEAFNQCWVPGTALTTNYSNILGQWEEQRMEENENKNSQTDFK